MNNPNPAKKGRCDQRYPRPYNEVTKDEKDGYAEYRRRDDGRSCEKVSRERGCRGKSFD